MKKTRRKKRVPLLKGVTVTQVFRAIGVEPDKHLTWTVGAVMAEQYLQEKGLEVPKANRPKTNGGGSHCMAVYPAGWFDRIAEQIHKVCANKESQHALF
jgi:hypothetical protein